MKKNYETLYIIDSAVTEEARKTLIEKFKALITKNGAEDVSVNEWGMRKFAYTINFKNEGFYVLMSFVSETLVPAKIRDEMLITETIVRFTTTVKE